MSHFRHSDNYYGGRANILDCHHYVQNCEVPNEDDFFDNCLKSLMSRFSKIERKKYTVNTAVLISSLLDSDDTVSFLAVYS